jgi:hypothetical protein
MGHFQPNQNGKCFGSSNSPLRSSPSICYKQFTESSGVASRSYCLQLSGFVRHLSSRERVTLSIVPATGLHSESSTYPKGTFKARTSKRIFSQFFVFRLGLPKMHAESGVLHSDRKAILLRAFERQRKAIIGLEDYLRPGRARVPLVPPRFALDFGFSR